jgi:hypothetical protein
MKAHKSFSRRAGLIAAGLLAASMFNTAAQAVPSFDASVDFALGTCTATALGEGTSCVAGAGLPADVFVNAGWKSASVDSTAGTAGGGIAATNTGVHIFNPVPGADVGDVTGDITGGVDVSGSAPVPGAVAHADTYWDLSVLVVSVGDGGLLGLNFSSISATVTELMGGAASVAIDIFEADVVNDDLNPNDYVAGQHLVSVDTSAGSDVAGLAIPNDTHPFNYFIVRVSAEGNARNTQMVPEPGTVALLGLGLVAFGVARRRRNA